MAVGQQHRERPRRPAPNGYEHLEPPFVERDTPACSDGRRADLREQLILGYRPVAQHIARRFHHRSDNPDDVEQVATLGLVLAVDRFDAERGVCFLSFAVPTITGEVLRYFRDRSAAVRLPRRLRQLQGEIFGVVAQLSQRQGRAPRPSEIAAAMGVPVEVVLEALEAQGATHTWSLDEPARTDDGRAGDRLRLDHALEQVDPHFELAEHRSALEPLLATLPERERRILLLRFFGGLTQTEIGERVGISQMHVSRLLTRTLARLRRAMADG